MKTVYIKANDMKNAEKLIFQIILSNVKTEDGL